MSRQAGHAAVRRLQIEVVDGKVHADKATAIYRAMTRPRVRVAGRAAEVTPDEGRISYDEARRRQAVADALMAERAELLQRRELVRVADLRMSMGRYLTAARDICLGTGARLAPLLAAEGDIAKCAALIDVEMRGVLHALVEADAKALQGEVPAP
jgi:hypothetical protein